METVISADGTPIAFDRTGSGPPLVLVHGAGGSHARFGHIVPALAEKFTVYAMDRRGRGASGDAGSYAIEREFEDVAAVADALDGPVNLYGHSYGGTCALEAALLTDNIGKLVIYEAGANPPGAVVDPGDLPARMDALVAAGDREGALVLFMRELVGMSDAEIDQVRATPAWQARLDAVHTVPREIVAEASYTLEPARFAKLRVPMLLLIGGASPPVLRDPTDLIHAALPNSRIVEMAGQQHVADITAPDLFIREVMTFLCE